MNFRVIIDDDIRPNALVMPNYGNSYPRQMPIHLYIDPEEKTVTTDTNDFRQVGIPADIFNNKIIYFILPYNVDASLLKNWLETDKELIEMINNLIESYECCWDGNNYVGGYDVDIETSIKYYIDRYIPTIDHGGLVYPGDWFGGVTYWSNDGKSVTIDCYPKITADTTDEQLGAMASEMKDDADSEGVVFDGTAIDFLESLRDECSS